MSPERINTKLNQVRFETDGHNKLTWRISFPIVQAIFNLSRSEITGTIPSEGPGLIISNHINMEDPFWLYFITAATSHRTIRCWASQTLLDANAPESVVARRRRTQLDLMRGGKGEKIRYNLVKYVIGPYLKSYHPIPARIGGINRDSLRQSIKELDQGRLVGIFFQGTRKPVGDLINFLPGAAIIAKARPDVPIYPLGISNTDKGFFGSPFSKRTFNIGPPFTYNQLLEQDSGLKETESTKQLIHMSYYFADRIGELITDPKIIKSWLISKELRDSYGYTTYDLETAKKDDPTLEGQKDAINHDNPYYLVNHDFVM